MRRTASAAAAALLALSVVAPAAAAARSPDERGGSEVRRVRMIDAGINRFRPARITIDRRDRVRWDNVGSLTHTTTSNDGDWNGRVAPGDSFTRRFRRSGTFTYRCTIHPEMTGTIVVR
jgi:plastocyanin